MRNFTDGRVSERQTESQISLDDVMKSIMAEHKGDVSERPYLSFAKALGGSLVFSPYFPFIREPFSRELAPAEVFVSEGHEELLVRLRHAIETGSLAVVTGQVGSGKSTALRAVMHALDASRYRYIYLASSQLTPAEFYRSLLYHLNVQPRRGFPENKRLLTQIMLEWHQKGVKPRRKRRDGLIRFWRLGNFNPRFRVGSDSKNNKKTLFIKDSV